MLDRFSDEVSSLRISSVSPNMSRCNSYVASLPIRYPDSCVHGWLAKCGKKPSSLTSHLALLCASIMTLAGRKIIISAISFLSKLLCFLSF